MASCLWRRHFDTVGWFTRNAGVLHDVAKAFGLKQSSGNPVYLLLPEDIWQAIEPSLAASLEPMLDRMEKRWGVYRTGSLSGGQLSRWCEVFQICQAAEIWESHGTWVSDVKPRFGAGVKERFEMAASIQGEAWTAAAKERELIRRQVHRWLGNGIAVMPAAPAVAPYRQASEAEFGNFRSLALRILCPAGLAGCPQLVIPAAEIDGAPLGISLLGPPGSDADLTAMAVALATMMQG